MKKSQVITLIVLLVFLGLCIGGYFVGKQYFADKEKKEEAAKKTTVVEIETPNIIGLSYSYNGKTYTIVKDGNTWKNEDDKKMKLNQQSVGTMISSLGNFKATDVFKNPKDIAQYGFTKNKDGIKPETQEIYVKTKDDKYYDIYVGKQNPYDQSAYYVMVKGDNNVYLADYETIGEFQKTVNELEQEATTAANENVGVVK